MSKNKKLIRRCGVGTVQLREAADGAESRTIVGYAVRFGEPSDVLGHCGEKPVREYIAPEAITEELLRRSDIKMTLFHNPERLLARSRQGAGSLQWGIDAEGVFFQFDAPETADGDMALSAVRRGDIAGCSFMFGAYYDDEGCVVRSEDADGVTYTVRRIEEIFDFTLTDAPAYPTTTVSLRDVESARKEQSQPDHSALYTELQRAASVATYMN